MSEVKLGLGESPDPVYLFVGETIDEAGAVHPWHMYDHDAKMPIPVKQRALTGTVTGLRMLIKSFKGKQNVKLDITMLADKPYVIRSGIDTTFARGILSALEIVDDFSNPLTIVVANGGEKVVFGRLHYASTGQRVKFVWDKERKLFPLASRIQSKLGQTPQTWADVQATEQQWQGQEEETVRETEPVDLPDDEEVPF